MVASDHEAHVCIPLGFLHIQIQQQIEFFLLSMVSFVIHHPLVLQFPCLLSSSQECNVGLFQQGYLSVSGVGVAHAHDIQMQK